MWKAGWSRQQVRGAGVVSVARVAPGSVSTRVRGGGGVESGGAPVSPVSVSTTMALAPMSHAVLTAEEATASTAVRNTLVRGRG